MREGDTLKLLAFVIAVSVALLFINEAKECRAAYEQCIETKGEKCYEASMG